MRWLVVFCMVLSLLGCGELILSKCRPSEKIILVDNMCQFDPAHPVACIGQVWIRVKCPLE